MKRMYHHKYVQMETLINIRPYYLPRVLDSGSENTRSNAQYCQTSPATPEEDPPNDWQLLISANKWLLLIVSHQRRRSLACKMTSRVGSPLLANSPKTTVQFVTIWLTDWRSMGSDRKYTLEWFIIYLFNWSTLHPSEEQRCWRPESRFRNM